MVTRVPVVWWNANPAAATRRYWDQGLLEDLLSGEVWQVPGADIEWVHVEAKPAATGAAVPAWERDGAVLVVPARHNVEHVDALVEEVRRRQWALVVLTGDEEGAFGFERLVGLERCELWVMSPQPDRDYGGVARLLGSGYPPGIRAVARELAADGDRPVPWAFVGQVTHRRRRECVTMLVARADAASGCCVETAGFGEGLPQRDYWRVLANARVVLCPSGPVSPDSFRLFEALECGCVPVADDVTPDGRVHGFWRRVLGDVPFRVLDGEWADGSAAIDEALEGWPRSANVAFAWWQRHKREMAWSLVETVRRLAGLGPRSETPASAVTALIVTSPTPHHPSTEHLEIVVESVRAQLPGAEIVLAFDGVRPEQEHRRATYEEYVRRALWLANTRWRNVVPVVADEWLHQANLTRLALEHVRSPLLCFVEHDTPLVGEIDWDGIVDVLTRGELDVVRLHHETTIGPHHEHVRLDAEPVTICGVPVVRTYQWSQRPHVARVGWYRERVLRRHFAASARTMIEDVMHGVAATAWLEYGLAGWHRFRIGIYAPEGNMQRSTHLDSRRLVAGEETSGDPKYPMLFAYPDGVVPEGAPQPGRR